MRTKREREVIVLEYARWIIPPPLLEFFMRILNTQHCWRGTSLLTPLPNTKLYSVPLKQMCRGIFLNIQLLSNIVSRCYMLISWRIGSWDLRNRNSPQNFTSVQRLKNVLLSVVLQYLLIAEKELIITIGFRWVVPMATWWQPEKDHSVGATTTWRIQKIQEMYLP